MRSPARRSPSTPSSRARPPQYAFVDRSPVVSAYDRERTDAAQRLVQHDADRVGQIERTNRSQRRDAQHSVWTFAEQLLRKTHAFFPEHEGVAAPQLDVQVAPGRLSTEQPEARLFFLLANGGFCGRQVWMRPYFDERPVI